MNIWDQSKACGERWNMRCHYDKTMPAETKSAIQLYIRWLKRHYFLPNEIRVYFINKYKIDCLMDDGRAFGTTLFPDDCSEVIVRIACGHKKRPTSVDEWDNYIGGVLETLTHELTHVLYDSCDCRYSDRSLECRCTRDANELLDMYAATHKHLV